MIHVTPRVEPRTGYPDQLSLLQCASRRPPSTAGVDANLLNGYEPGGRRHDVVTIPVIWLAVLLSLLIHGLALWLEWPRLHKLIALDKDLPGKTSSLSVQIAENGPAQAATPPAAPPPAMTAVPPPTPRRVPRPPSPPRVPVRPPQAPPVLTRPEPQAPREPQPAPVPTVPPPQPPQPQPQPQQRPTPQPAEPDLASYIEARRKARGEAPVASSGATPGAQPGESEAERRNKIIAANLGLDRKPTFGYDPNSAGGLFQIKRVGYDDAEFYFLGFDKDIERTAKMVVEVRKGDAPDIRVAIVRRMIGIIRDNVHGDFLWSSQRLGHQVRLSARPEDNAGLEEFILRDVFGVERH